MRVSKKGLVWIMAIILMGIVYGCKDKVPSSDDGMQAYLSAWMKGDYGSMYEKLTDGAKATVAKEDFVTKHTSIYSGISASDLNIKLAFASHDEEAGNTRDTFGIHVQMNTIAGAVEFDQTVPMVLEHNEWHVEWTPGLLFPQMTDGDKVRVQVLKAERGEIVDRSGYGLAVNEEKLAIGIVPKDLSEPAEESIKKLAELLQMSVQDIDSKRQASWVKPDYFVPLSIVSTNDPKLLTIRSVKGVASQPKKVRAYPLDEAAAHLIGYVGKMNAEEWGRLKEKGYQEDDALGKAGLEQVFEERLRGTDGARIYIVDANGKEKGTITRKDPVNGSEIKLTVDSALQAQVFKQLEGNAGAGAAIHPVTGEVLALASSPSYNPNLFVSGVPAETWKRWNEDPDKPLLNRFARTFSPGSAFKPITAAIALDTHAIDPEQEREIAGKQWKKDGTWGNYYVTRVSAAATKVNLLKALLYSDNIYFAQTALEMGEQRFLAEAGKFGFGEQLPVPYPLDVSKLANQAMKNDIQLADSGYGQGEVVMNPLHVAAAYTAFVNGGNMIAPVLELEEGKTALGKVWKQGVIRPETAAAVTSDLIQVVDHPAGTGHDAKIEGLAIAAKTGTAELKQSKGTTGKEVGWFVAYNTEKPRLLLALMIENVQERGGSHLLSPKVKAVFKQYLR
ncbi:penicillin-binding transpeptidase domain-containing protein [Paenibacillus sp. MBLB4367]|uniref:penicillin-binding transpeptidase domain-containing protein n=1 Tax=Paenibacillus sp. MBLB4367 TaxID=3384767 RepID=UPI003907ED89